MAKYKIVGYERNKGVSKKTGNAYDMHILHCVCSRAMSGENQAGNAVDKIVIGESEGILTGIPKPGEVWEISFNRSGRVDDAYAVK